MVTEEDNERMIDVIEGKRIMRQSISKWTMYANPKKIHLFKLGKWTLFASVLNTLSQKIVPWRPLSVGMTEKELMKIWGLEYSKGFANPERFRDMLRRGYISRKKKLIGNRKIWHYFITPKGRAFKRKYMENKHENI